MDKFVLIDGNSLINRAFYATPPLSAPDGTPTNAVYAFMNMLIKIIDEVIKPLVRAYPFQAYRVFSLYEREDE